MTMGQRYLSSWNMLYTSGMALGKSAWSRAKSLFFQYYHAIRCKRDLTLTRKSCDMDRKWAVNAGDSGHCKSKLVQ